MATLTPKNLPDELVERLRREAKASCRSLDQETLARLEASLAVRWAKAEEKVERPRQARARFADREPFDAAFVRAVRRAGRPRSSSPPASSPPRSCRETMPSGCAGWPRGIHSGSRRP